MRGAPIHPDEYDGQHLNTDDKLREAGWAAGLDVWEQVGKAYEWYGPGGGREDTGALQNAQLWSLQQAIHAQAVRGGAVESWLKRRRDEYLDVSEGRTGAWYALDELLDDYREHADTGVPLDQDEGPIR